MKEWKKPEIWELNAKDTNEDSGLIFIEDDNIDTSVEDCFSRRYRRPHRRCS